MSDKSISVSQYFECPSCQCDQIEEVMTGVTISTTISDMHLLEKGSQPWIMHDTVDVEYGIHDDGNPTTEYGQVDHYQCINCGWVIRDGGKEDGEGTYITDPETLFEWLKQHKENREKELNTP